MKRYYIIFGKVENRDRPFVHRVLLNYFDKINEGETVDIVTNGKLVNNTSYFLKEVYKIALNYQKLSKTDNLEFLNVTLPKLG